MHFTVNHKQMDLSLPRVMGVLNLTPDSFYDGGRYFLSERLDVAACLRHADVMISEGADFIDVGGESTRPGAEAISRQEEMDRVLPVVECITQRSDVIVSVDTSCPELMLEAAKLGVGLINDVRALRHEGAVDAAAQSGLPICLMHMQGQPKTMQNRPKYNNVQAEVDAFFQERIATCKDAGISESKIILDPGIGFGKSDQHNLTLLRNVGKIASGRFPLLVGVSRKSLFGRLLGRDVKDRLAGSLAFAYQALIDGANILRVHDVAPTVDIVKSFRHLTETPCEAR